MSEDPDVDSDLITCWCGATGCPDELFDDSGIDGGCGGTGTLDCLCGGDFCVCHNHGETECPGCEDCEFNDGDDYDGGDCDY